MKPTETKNLSWKDAWWYLLNGRKIKRPLWVCKHPELECKDCDILKEYVEAYRKGGPDEH